MSPATQVKVLRALQSGEFRRIGSNRHIKADIRVIAATNKDLRQEVEKARFREDLYYRIAVIEIPMPPLRERTGGHSGPGRALPPDQCVRGRERLQVTPEAMVCLTRYPLAGQHPRSCATPSSGCSVLADSQVLTVDTLPPAIAKSGQEPSEPGFARPADGPQGDGASDLTLDEVERHHILRTLERHRWNKEASRGHPGHRHKNAVQQSYDGTAFRSARAARAMPPPSS